jgi:hypothetical protein
VEAFGRSSDGIGVVPEVGAQLEGLPDPLEKDFAVPSAAMGVAHAGRAPVRGIGDEDHQALLPGDFNPGLDASDNPPPSTWTIWSRMIFPSSLTGLRRTRKLVLSLALATLSPAEISWTEGTAGFAANRRTPGGPTDPALPVLVAQGRDGAVRAIVASSNAPATPAPAMVGE